MKEKRLCIICDTPYQLLNTISYVCSQKEFDFSNVDVLVCNRDISEKQIERLKGRPEIGNVFVYNTDLYDKDNTFYRVFRFFFPKRFLNSHIVGGNSIPCDEYSHLMCAFPMPITIAFTMSNPKIIVRLMDDGIGTYTGNISIPISKKKSVMFFLKGTSSPWTRIEKIYLNNISYYKGNLSAPCEEILQYSGDEETINKTIQEIIGYMDEDLYLRNNIIYLTQPLDMNKRVAGCYWDEEGRIQSIFKKEGVSALVRKHPKQQDYVFMGMPEDCNNNLWELICKCQITNKHCLIGCFSTAQFSPKFIYNKEPWVIFTYELYDGIFDDETIARMNHMVQQLRNSYLEREKILVAKNEEDLCAKMKMINKSHQTIPSV